MILELITASRLKRELNCVIRKLGRGNPDIFIVSRNGDRVAYLIAPDRYHDWMHRIDHADSEEAIRLLRLKKQSRNARAED